MPDRRIINILDPAGYIVKSINISDLDNADTQCPLTFEVSTRCDMGHEHITDTYILNVWGPRLINPMTGKEEK
jgi:hypothetical protein